MSCTSTPDFAPPSARPGARPAARPARRTGNVVRDIRDLPRVTQGRIAQRLSAVPAPSLSGQPGARLRPMRPSA